jgi:hypothetical protein
LALKTKATLKQFSKQNLSLFLCKIENSVIVKRFLLLVFKVLDNHHVT